jgi:hypothetical protein
METVGFLLQCLSSHNRNEFIAIPTCLQRAALRRLFCAKENPFMLLREEIQEVHQTCAISIGFSSVEMFGIILAIELHRDAE